MRQVLTGIGALLMAACGPDLSDNGALRCEDSLECGPEAACYRGFCVAEADLPDGGGPGAPPTVVDPQQDGTDGGQMLSYPDAGVELYADAELAVVGEAPVDAATPPVTTPPMTTPPPVTTPPVTTAPVPTPPTPAPAPAADAGVPPNSSCTLKECCAEAKRAYEERVKNANNPSYKPKQGKCGCSAPDPLNTLTCGLGSLTGLT